MNRRVRPPTLPDVDTPAERSAAYAEFLAGLVDLRQDVATERFDAAIAALEASGGLERGEAGRLRYWQRESLRTQADQLISTAAASLAALDRARADAASAVASADAVWESVEADVTKQANPTDDLDATATAAEADADAEAEADADADADPSASEQAPVAPSAEDIDLTIVLVPSMPAPTPEPSLPTPSVSADPAAPPNRGRHRAPAHAAPRRDEAAPPVAASTDAPPARRRRLLVAGLTVVDNSDDPSETDSLDRSAPHDQPAVG